MVRIRCSPFVAASFDWKKECSSVGSQAAAAAAAAAAARGCAIAFVPFVSVVVLGDVVFVLAAFLFPFVFVVAAP